MTDLRTLIAISLTTLQHGPEFAWESLSDRSQDVLLRQADVLLGAITTAGYAVVRPPSDQALLAALMPVESLTSDDNVTVHVERPQTAVELAKAVSELFKGENGNEE